MNLRNSYKTALPQICFIIEIGTSLLLNFLLFMT